MQDIGEIQKNVDNLNYSVALKQLELEAVKTTILDKEGNEYLKTGIFTDKMYNFDHSDYSHEEWSATVDEYDLAMRPAVHQKSLRFEYSEGDSERLKKNTETLTLDWTETEWIRQRQCSSAINVQELMFHLWRGEVELTPSIDVWVDDLGEKIVSQVYTETPMPQTIVRLEDTTNVSVSGRTTTTVTNANYREDTYEMAGFGISNRNLVSRTRPSDWMRPIPVAYDVRGIRQGSVIDAYIDGVKLELSNNTADSHGFLSGSFTIPEKTIPVGAAAVEFYDPERISYASTVYKATGTEIWKDVTEYYLREWLLVNTRAFSEEISRTSVTRSGDPIAESFYVDNPEGVYLSAFDVFFKDKDPSVPVEIRIVETMNGYPSDKVLPFSRVLRTPDEVNISEDGSAATRFEFKEPVYLYGQTEYAIVVATESYKYTAWTAKMGETDRVTGIGIAEQPFLGSFFKSQNARTWSADQSRDLAFIAYRCEFEREGTAIFGVELPEESIEVAMNSFATDVFRPYGTAVKFYYLWESDVDWTEYSNYSTVKYHYLKHVWKLEDVNYTGYPPLRVKMVFTSGSGYVSPELDMMQNSGVFYRNILEDNEDESEKINFPYYAGAWLSKPIQLRYPSEDIRIFLHEKLPNRSKCEVYIKFNDWTSLFVEQQPYVEGTFGYDTSGPEKMVNERCQVYWHNEETGMLIPKSELIVTNYDGTERKLFVRSVAVQDDLRDVEFDTVIDSTYDIYHGLPSEITSILVLKFLSDAEILLSNYSIDTVYPQAAFVTYSGDIWKCIKATQPGYLPFEGSLFWEKVPAVNCISSLKRERDLQWRKLKAEHAVNSADAGLWFYEYEYEMEQDISGEQFQLFTVKIEFYSKDRVNMPECKNIRAIALL
jgi:hypothetical protein